jgi:predicted nuclease with TOPRIM domain
LINNYDNAFVEFKEAERYDPENQEIKNKMEKLRTKFISDFQIETESLTKIETKDIPVDTTQRIISLLDGIKSTFPEHYKETRMRVEKLGKEMPYDLLNPLRRIAEEYFNKIYKGSKRKSFRTKVKELLDRNEINNYIKNLLELIWTIGSRGSHPPPAYVRELKLEDIEVLISAEVRFLHWYIEKYSKKK